MNRQYSEQRIVIAGGSSGMGFALARRLVAQGGTITIVGRDAEKLNRAKAALNSERLHVVAADITSEDDTRQLFAKIGPIDHIVCTAADFSGAYDLLGELNIQAAHRAIDSKLLGPILLAKHGSPVLGEGGSITFTSGIAAYRPMARGTIVAAINAALEGLVRALAVELAPLRVNAVSPGWIDTPIWQHVAGDRTTQVLGEMAARLPVGRVGNPDDIADALEFLMGNGFTTGSILHVDGGHRLI